jgi:hypothetical protein
MSDREMVKNQKSKTEAPGQGRWAFLSLLNLFESSTSRDAKSWTRLFEMLVEFRLSDNSEISADEQSVLDVIIQSLFAKVTAKDRRNLAKNLSTMAQPPNDLTVSLISDEFTIAAPILARVDTLSDVHLTNLIAEQKPQHNQLIAKRTGLSQTVICALLEHGGDNVFDELLRNENAVFAEIAITKLMSVTFGDQKREARLLDAPHLTATTAFHSYWKWHPSLKWTLLERFILSPEAYGQTLEGLVGKFKDEEVASATLRRAIEIQDRLAAVEAQKLANLLNLEHVDGLVEFMLSGLLLDAGSVKKILTDTSGASLSVFCRAVGLDVNRFTHIYSSLYQNELSKMEFELNLQLSIDNFEVMEVSQAAAIVTCLTLVKVGAPPQSIKDIAA